MKKKQKKKFNKNHGRDADRSERDWNENKRVTISIR